MADEFKRENRYLVIKRKDLNDLNWATISVDMDDFVHDLGTVLDKINTNRSAQGRGELSCVVIESDWACYERAWQLVESEARRELTLEEREAKAIVQDYVARLMVILTDPTIPEDKEPEAFAEVVRQAMDQGYDEGATSALKIIKEHKA